MTKFHKFLKKTMTTTLLKTANPLKKINRLFLTTFPNSSKSKLIKMPKRNQTFLAFQAKRNKSLQETKKSHVKSAMSLVLTVSQDAVTTSTTNV